MPWHDTGRPPGRRPPSRDERLSGIPANPFWSGGGGSRTGPESEIQLLGRAVRVVHGDYEAVGLGVFEGAAQHSHPRDTGEAGLGQVDGERSQRVLELVVEAPAQPRSTRCVDL